MMYYLDRAFYGLLMLVLVLFLTVGLHQVRLISSGHAGLQVPVTECP